MKALYAADQGRKADPTGLDHQQNLHFPTDLSLPPVHGGQVRDDVDAGSQAFVDQRPSHRLPDPSAGTGDQYHEAPRAGQRSGFVRVLWH